jgi:hypothetical protein
MQDPEHREYDQEPDGEAEQRGEPNKGPPEHQRMVTLLGGQ